MNISVLVVCEHDPFQHKERHFVDAWVAQTLPLNEFELVIVDHQQGSGAAACFAGFRRQYPGLNAQVLRSASGARSIGTNHAARASTGEILLILADDFEPLPGTLRAHAAFHAANPDVNAVGIGAGLFSTEIRQDPFARWLEDSGGIFGVPLRQSVAVWPDTFFYAGNASLKRDKFFELNGFNEQFPMDALDDLEFGLRLIESGGYTRFLANAAALHRHAVSFEERKYGLFNSARRASRVFERIRPDWAARWPELQRADVGAGSCTVAAHGYETDTIATWQRAMDAAFAAGYRGDAIDHSR